MSEPTEPPYDPPPDPSLPTSLGGIDPGELFARGMQSAKMSGGGAHGWMPPTPEEVAHLFPNYEILSMLGRGGMGAVYKARQTALDRLVAIKLLPLEISVDQAFADRFRREARAMAKLNHPHIISVFDFGQTGEGHLFFAMEFVEGANLHDIIHHSDITPDQALAIAAQICTALAYAHGKGVVHRDIKPANVMLDTESQVKVADFGLARLIDAGTEDLGHTVTGTVMGTPDYMAPEQKRGMNVDHRADIYSLGVMLYEMLCRETPQGAFAPPSARMGCDTRIDGIVLKAMQQAPDHRYQSTREMKADVESARTPLPMPAAPPAVALPKPPPRLAKVAKPVSAKNGRAPLWIASVIALALLAGGVALVAKHRAKDEAPAVPLSATDILTSPDYEWSVPENFGPKVNTSRGENHATLSDDQLVMVFGRFGDVGQLMECRRASADQPFGEPIAIVVPGMSNCAAPWLSGDGLTMLFHSMSGPDNRGSNDLFEIRRSTRNSPWTPPVNLGSDVNTPANEMTPFSSPDGLTLLFSSDRPGTRGRCDLWRSTRKSATASFGPPENLRDAVNSVNYRQWLPLITPDGKALLFIREIADQIVQRLFIAEIGLNGVIEPARPLELPFTSVASSWLSPDGRTFYFSSDAPGGHGDYDLWQIHRVRKSPATAKPVHALSTPATATN